MIDEFTRELEAVGGHVHHGRAALEELVGEGVSVTPCLALIAETGTAVVSARLPDLAAALRLIGPELAASSAVTLVTGPSRTADIEQNLIRGVHGPGEVHVVFVQPS